MNNTIFNQWIKRHNIPQQAVDELRMMLIANHLTVPRKGVSESAVQSAVRLEAAENNVWFTRNNVGVLKNDKGVPVRYGLCNSSPQENKVCKSSDLIGIKPLLITPDMIGSTVGQFIARETKRVDWQWSGNEHEQAQLNFLNLVVSLGGDAAFCNGVGSL